MRRDIRSARAFAGVVVQCDYNWQSQLPHSCRDHNNAMTSQRRKELLCHRAKLPPALRFPPCILSQVLPHSLGTYVEHTFSKDLTQTHEV